MHIQEKDLYIKKQFKYRETIDNFLIAKHIAKQDILAINCTLAIITICNN